jgi:small-conductance mechanosensitive channel
MQLEISAPYHAIAVQAVQARNVTPEQMDRFINEVANVDLQVLQDYLSKHVRTGETLNSVKIRTLERSNNKVSVAVGTQTRGSQLRWLDVGRREVYPINRKFLRWIAHPSGAIVFARHARATQASGIMRQAATTAMAKAPEIAQRTIQVIK